MKFVLVTGGFDPIHSGHIAYFKAAKKLGDCLVVGLNSDDWLKRKKGRSFLPYEERAAIIRELSVVDYVINFNDDDNTAIDAINKVFDMDRFATVVFANGGDRTKDNIPEMKAFNDDQQVQFVFGVGGEDKKNSSSWILEEWKAPKTERTWGYYRVLHEVPGMKVKELTVNPGQQLSMQRHNHRSEYWIVSEGEAVVNSLLPSGYIVPPALLTKHREYRVPVGEWHQLTNPSDNPVRIVEVQYGALCEEEDIERKDG